MKTLTKVTLVVAILAVAIGIVSFRSNVNPKQYQHLMIYAEHYDLDKVFISIDGKEYKELKLTKQIKGPWDMNPLINLIHQYEMEGWELDYCNVYGASFFYLRREVN